MRVMFIGKFNFSKACSNVVSPAFTDKPVIKRRPRRPGQALEEQNEDLDKKTSAFAAKNAGKKWAEAQRSRKEKASKTLEPPKGMKRGISADPHLRGARSKTEGEASPLPDISVTPAEGESERSRKQSKERLKKVVNTKVNALNAFKKGVKPPPEVEGKSHLKVLGLINKSLHN